MVDKQKAGWALGYQAVLVLQAHPVSDGRYVFESGFLVDASRWSVAGIAAGLDHRMCMPDSRIKSTERLVSAAPMPCRWKAGSTASIQIEPRLCFGSRWIAANPTTLPSVS
jgi:hypothetical protein